MPRKQSNSRDRVQIFSHTWARYVHNRIPIFITETLHLGAFWWLISSVPFVLRPSKQNSQVQLKDRQYRLNSWCYFFTHWLTDRVIQLSTMSSSMTVVGPIWVCLLGDCQLVVWQAAVLPTHRLIDTEVRKSLDSSSTFGSWSLFINRQINPLRISPYFFWNHPKILWSTILWYSSTRLLSSFLFFRCHIFNMKKWTIFRKWTSVE